MKIIEVAQTALDLRRVASAGDVQERMFVENEERYERFAIGLDKQVARGSLDPFIAEDRLEQFTSAQVTAAENPNPTTEKAARALVRLVDKGIIDPFFAADIIDKNFRSWTILAAVKHSSLVKR